MDAAVLGKNALVRRRVWVTWERQRRNRTMSVAVDAKLYEFVFTAGRLRRYVLAGMHTIRMFVRERPRLVFVQNPSLVLAMLATVYGRLFRIPVVVDAHNGGIFPFEGRKRWVNSLVALLFRTARLTIVTNAALAAYVRGRGGRAAVVPDPMPVFKEIPRRRTLRGKHNVLFICTWAADEPYDQVFEAARLLSSEIVVYVSGNSRGREKLLRRPLPENVVLTGFLDEETYADILHTCDVVVDLTTREDCLVCGAYEAVAAGRPLVVSGTAALRDYFHLGTLYTDNTAEDIAAKIHLAISRNSELATEIIQLRHSCNHKWRGQLMKLESSLRALTDEQ